MTFQELESRIETKLNSADWHQHPNGGGWVENTAYVGGNARVGGTARVEGGVWDASPLYIRSSLFGCTNSAPGVLLIGCMAMPFSEWLEKGQAIARREGLTEDQIKEHEAIVRLFIAIGK